MPQLVPVDTDPFASSGPRLVPVDHDPFDESATPPEGYYGGRLHVTVPPRPVTVTPEQLAAGVRTVGEMLMPGTMSAAAMPEQKDIPPGYVGKVPRNQPDYAGAFGLGALEGGSLIEAPAAAIAAKVGGLAAGKAALAAIPLVTRFTGEASGAAARTAAEGGEGLLSKLIQRGKELLPSYEPTSAEVAAARADTRTGGDVVGNRMNVIVPESERVAGGTYTPGAPNGGRWADLPPETLNSPGLGFRITDDQLKDLWQKSVDESSQAAKNAVEKSGASPVFKAEDWDAAMRLPIRDHLWYELSGEKMAENLPQLSSREFLQLMDLIGATSARADPSENLQRALAAMSQHMRGVPIDVDLAVPSTVQKAIGRGGTDVSALSGNKTGMFSDTLALTGGVPTRFPISVNDVWVGKMFGVPDDVMSSNQSLHEVMAKYFNKIRDAYNTAHPEAPFKYQSWNFQAPAWVHLRNSEAGATSGDAYHQVWSNLTDKLRAAGVEGIEGDKITRRALMDPRFADALRATTPGWRSAPKATVEFGTTQTNVGSAAHDLYKRAIELGDTKSQEEYLKGVVSPMYNSARGKDHPWDLLRKAITGDLSSDITRIINPSMAGPLDIGGTFEGAVSPNIRIPLKGLSDDQIEHFNAIAGKHLRQDAMAASQILDAVPGSAPRDGYVRGRSLFVPTVEQMKPDEIRSFAAELSKSGHDMSYARYPNLYRFDILPNFSGDAPRGVSADDLSNAFHSTLGTRFDDAAIVEHDFKSVYTPSDQYNAVRNRLIKGIKDDFVRSAATAGIPEQQAKAALKDQALAGGFTGGGRKAWNTYLQRLDHLSRAEDKLKGLAADVSDAHSNFIESATKRMAKRAKDIADLDRIQAQNPSVQFVPVDHDPFQ